jgi:uncharacterized protein with ATP-grasp and redox domains
MRTYIDCVPCFIRQAIDATRLVSGDENIAERVLRRVLTAAATMRMDRPPPFMGREIHHIIREETGSADPYAPLKEKSTHWALDFAEQAEGVIANAEDPFEVAVRFAIAGNVMDYALATTWDADSISTCVEEALLKPIDAEALRLLREAVSKAETILYIGDNAGETVFDRMLIRRLPEHAVTYAVKSSPIINDATSRDAEAAGIGNVARIVANGTDAPGTILDLCSPEFQDLFENADVVIAKGQANLETLGDSTRDVFFLTQIKCPVVARDRATQVGDWVVAYRQPGDSTSAS